MFFPTSVGRRLVLIVLTMTITVVGLLVYISVDAATTALNTVNEQNFESTHLVLRNAIERQKNSIEERLFSLSGIVNTRSRWSSGELRAYVIDLIGGSSSNQEIISVNFYRSEGQQQIYTYDYQVPEDLPAGIILPINRSTAPEDIPQDSWFQQAVFTSEPRWFGPHPSLFSAYPEQVMSFAVPIADPAGLLWVDVPIAVFNEVLQNLIETDTTTIDENGDTIFSYDILINNRDNNPTIIATSNPNNTRTLAGFPIELIVNLPDDGSVTRMNDPILPDERSFVLVDDIENTSWALITSTSVRSLTGPLPFESVARLTLVTILGLAVLSLIIQYYIDRAVTEPLERISIAAQEIGAGDLRYTVSAQYRNRQDEVGRLARAFDDMKSNLSRSYDELEGLKISLEKRVQTRTRELRQASRKAEINANELQAVYTESLFVVSAYQLQTILEALTQRIYNLLDASYSAVWLLDDTGEQLRLVSTSETSKRRLGRLIPVGEGLVGTAVETREIQVVDDYPRWRYRSDVAATDVMQQAIAVPLIFSGDAIGAVVVGRPYDSDPFDAEEQRLLRLFANLVSPAVRNAQLYVQRDTAVKEAQRANQVKTRFLASVTHELRTPLNLVINNMDFMRIGAFGDVTEEQVSRLDQTIRSAEHLLYLINDLLDVSKIEAGEMQLFIQENDLYPLLQDAIDNTVVYIDQFNKTETVEFLIAIDEDIDPFPMDARRVRQILVNLLSNAVKFTESGSVTLTVENRRHYVRIAVTDTGMGIPDDELGKLFEAFERTNSAKEKAIEGTGLGLPICKFLAEAHGGALNVRSVVGEGTTFIFDIPVKQRSDTIADTQQMDALLDRIPRDASNQD